MLAAMTHPSRVLNLDMKAEAENFAHPFTTNQLLERS